MESRKVWVSQHEAEMETKCTLSTAQIPALPNHFISPVEIRDPISGKTVPESLFSLFPDLVCPIWLIYLLPPENTGHQVEHLFFISFLQEINSTQRERACKHCQKSYRITQYSRHVTAWMLAAACCHEGLHTGTQPVSPLLSLTGNSDNRNGSFHPLLLISIHPENSIPPFSDLRLGEGLLIWDSWTWRSCAKDWCML